MCLGNKKIQSRYLIWSESIESSANVHCLVRNSSIRRKVFIRDLNSYRLQQTALNCKSLPHRNKVSCGIERFFLPVEFWSLHFFMCSVSFEKLPSKALSLTMQIKNYIVIIIPWTTTWKNDKYLNSYVMISCLETPSIQLNVKFYLQFCVDYFQQVCLYTIKINQNVSNWCDAFQNENNPK